jgi:hypothetical protein
MSKMSGFAMVAGAGVLARAAHGDDDIVTITGLPLAPKIRSGYLPISFGCMSVREREPWRTFGGKAKFFASVLLDSSCCDTLSTLSQLKLSLQGSFDP